MAKSTSLSIVKQHTRSGRPDFVGDALRDAYNLKQPRTLHDWLIEWSENNYNPEKWSDGVIWHLDPVTLRSAIIFAQARLRVSTDEVRSASGEVIVRARPAGEFNGLLGKKIFPSAAGSGKKRGPVAKWSGDVEGKINTRVTPNGLSNPAIVLLVAKAKEAGHPNYGSDDYVAELACLAVGTRAKTIAHLREKFNDECLLQERVVQAHLERDKAVLERDEAMTKVKRLQKFEFFDIEQFEADFGKKYFKSAPSAPVPPTSPSAPI